MDRGHRSAVRSQRCSPEFLTSASRSSPEERLSKNQLVGRGEQIEQRQFTLRALVFNIQGTTGNSKMRGSGALENGSTRTSLTAQCSRMEIPAREEGWKFPECTQQSEGISAVHSKTGVIEINAQPSKVKTPKRSKITLPPAIDPDIKIAFPERVLVCGRVLDSEWKGDLPITGTACKPVVKGILTVVRGKYRVF